MAESLWVLVGPLSIHEMVLPVPESGGWAVSQVAVVAVEVLVVPRCILLRTKLFGFRNEGIAPLYLLLQGERQCGHCSAGRYALGRSSSWDPHSTIITITHCEESLKSG